MMLLSPKPKQGQLKLLDEPEELDSKAIVPLVHTTAELETVGGRAGKKAALALPLQPYQTIFR